MEQFLHGTLAFLLHAEKCVERDDNAPDEREVHAEANLHLGEIEGDIRENRENHDHEEHGFHTDREADDIAQR